MDSAFNSNSQKAEEFETISVYIASSNTARVTSRDLISEIEPFSARIIITSHHLPAGDTGSLFRRAPQARRSKAALFVMYFPALPSLGPSNPSGVPQHLSFPSVAFQVLP